jgi:Rrf2 family protein
MKNSSLQFAAMISKTAEYALRAMVALKNQHPGDRVLNRDLSATTGIPQNYLSKIMHALGRAGLVMSERGPGGGFRLRRNAGAITAYQIVALFEDLEGTRRCLLGQSTCRDDNGCPAHEAWKAVREAYEGFLKKTTLDVLSPDLAEVAPVQTRPRPKTKRRLKADS